MTSMKRGGTRLDKTQHLSLPQLWGWKEKQNSTAFLRGSTIFLHTAGHTSHSSMVLGGTAVRTRSSTGTAWMNTNSSEGGKKGASFWPKFNSTTQFLQRTWGRRARSARDSLLIRNATPRSSPFLEKESSTSSVSKFCNDK